MLTQPLTGLTLVELTHFAIIYPGRTSANALVALLVIHKRFVMTPMSVVDQDFVGKMLDASTTPGPTNAPVLKVLKEILSLDAIVSIKMICTRNDFFLFLLLTSRLDLNSNYFRSAIDYIEDVMTN